MQIAFKTTPAGKEIVARYFADFKKTTVISTHDGVHIAVHPDGPRDATYHTAYKVSSLPGVEAMTVTLRNHRQCDA